MSTGDHHKDSYDEMATGLPPLKWSKETFNGLVQNFKFPDSWDARYPDESQTSADAPTGYITLFWDFFFSTGNFRLPTTKFFLDILSYYKFHISQMHPLGMVRIRHFEFACRGMRIEPTVDRFRMIFRGKEDVPNETIQTLFSENWYQDLKDVPSIDLSEKALVGASMSLNWQMNREDKQVYMEDGKVVSLYVLAFEREGGKMATIPKRANEELWYLRIVKNFVLPRDEDLATQPATSAVGELSNLGIGPEKKKRVPATTTAPRKNDAEKAQSSKAKNVRGEKKGMRHSFDSWCDYVVVSDLLEGLAPAVVRKPKAESRDIADIPSSNLDDPIDLESSPEHLLKPKAGKRKQTDTEAARQPVKKVQSKKITRRGNLDAFIAKPVLEKPSSPVHAEPSSAVNEDLPPSPPRAPIIEQLKKTKATGNDEAEKIAGVEDPGVVKTADVAAESKKVTSPEAVDVDFGHPKSPEVVAQDPEKGKSAQETPITTSENIEKNPGGDQGSFIQADENSPIRLDETPRDYYYRCYLEK
ncbi:hypothetical protein Hdeb2414_s0019g00546451 [Helianthus debilis subsp. tardiflorus]